MEDILYLTHRLPYPPNKGDKIRAYHVLRHLGKTRRVHLGAFVDDRADWEHAAALRDWCGEIKLIGLDPRTARLRSLAGLGCGKPLTLAYYANAEMHAWVDRMLADYGVKKAVVFSSAMAQFVEHKHGLRRIADFADVDSDKWRQYAPTKPWPLSWLYRHEAATLLAYERKIAATFDATLFVTEPEAALFRRLAPESTARIGWFANGVDADFFTPQRGYPNPYAPHEAALVFTGAMDYWPNVDAVAWFAHTVFPAIHARFPDARFYIVGARPVAAVRRLAREPGVIVTGQVPDVRGYLAHARMAVAPLRMARGVQNKVLEAMAMAKPVVASPQAAQGIHTGGELLLAGDAAEFQESVAAVLDGRHAALGAAARARVQADHDWARNLARLDAADCASPPGNNAAANP